MTKTHRENIPFFSDLPGKAYSAANRLWDAIQSPAYNGAKAYGDFVQDLTFQGLVAPPRAVVKRWQAGVQSGLISRPDPLPNAVPGNDAVDVTAQPTQIDVQIVNPVTSDVEQPVVMTGIDPETRRVFHTRVGKVVSLDDAAAFEKLTPTTYDRLREAGVMPTPIQLKFLPDAPDPTLVLIRNQMINEVVAQLNINIRAQAEAIVADRFRQIADGMERATN